MKAKSQHGQRQGSSSSSSSSTEPSATKSVTVYIITPRMLSDHSFVQGPVEYIGDVEKVRVGAADQEGGTGKTCLIIQNAIDCTVIVYMASRLRHGVTTWISGSVRGPCDVVPTPNCFGCMLNRVAVVGGYENVGNVGHVLTLFCVTKLQTRFASRGSNIKTYFDK